MEPEEGAGSHGKVLGLVVRQLVPESVPRHRLERNKAVFRGTLARRVAGFDEQVLRGRLTLRHVSGCLGLSRRSHKFKYLQ